MSGCSSIYEWAGGRDRPPARPECSRATHASLINRSGAELHKARVDAYARYSRECRAWGREPEPEQLWFAHANAEATRIRKGLKC